MSFLSWPGLCGGTPAVDLLEALEGVLERRGASGGPVPLPEPHLSSWRCPERLGELLKTSSLPLPA